MAKAIVLYSISGISKIKDLDSSLKLLAEIKGTLLNKKTIIMPGDYVEYESIQDTNLITKIYERKNFLVRPKISNIDYLVIVQSFKEPNMSLRMLNKYILYFQSKKIDNIILFFTKFDILNNEEIEEAIKKINHFKNDGFQVFYLKDFNLFLEFINSKNNNIICFTGQSGVGKSTLLNKINDEFNIKTNIISKALNRGKHTTTTTILHEYMNGYLVDTPGFSAIELDLKKEEIAKGYADFRNYSLMCKFANCLHNSENNCEVKKMVNDNKISKERYEDYIFFLNKIK